MPKSIKVTILIILVFLSYGLYQYVQGQKNPLGIDEKPSIEAPRSIKISGEYVCLPHKNTSGPQTLECAYGIKSTEGLFYALDLNPLGSDAVFDFQTGKKIEVEGTFTPLENLSTNHWQKYNIKGIITVESLKNI